MNTFAWLQAVRNCISLKRAHRDQDAPKTNNDTITNTANTGGG